MKKLLPVYISIAVLIAYGSYQTIEVNRLEEDISSVKNDLLTLSKENKQLKNEVSGLQNEIEDLQSSSDDLDGRIGVVEDALHNTRLVITSY